MVPVHELIARASASAASVGDDDFLSAVDADLPNLSHALARARSLAGGPDSGGELDALLKVSASPVARSVADASSALAELLGSPTVPARRAASAARTRPRGKQSPPSEAPSETTATASDDPDPDPEPPAALAEPAVPVPEVDPAPAADRDADRARELEAIADHLIAGLIDESGPVAAPETPPEAPSKIIEARRAALDAGPGVLPGMPPTTPTPPPVPTPGPVLDASEVDETSSSGSIDLSDLADQLLNEGGAPDLAGGLERDLANDLSHDLDADALDAEGLLASGVDRLITPRQRRKSAPVSLPASQGLSSFADPPTMTGADSMPGQPLDEPLDELDAALEALESEPVPERAMGAPPPPRPPPRNDFDAEAQPLLTRAEGPPTGMMPPPLPRAALPPQQYDDEETDVGDFDVDIDIDIEADYDGFEPQPPEKVDPDAHARRRARAASARALATEGEAPSEAPTDGDEDDELDEDGKKKGIFSRMFGRKKQ
jgi:hypothetical protein